MQNSESALICELCKKEVQISDLISCYNTEESYNFAQPPEPFDIPDDCEIVCQPCLNKADLYLEYQKRQASASKEIYADQIKCFERRLQNEQQTKAQPPFISQQAHDFVRKALAPRTFDFVTDSETSDSEIEIEVKFPKICIGLQSEPIERHAEFLQRPPSHIMFPISIKESSISGFRIAAVIQEQLVNADEINCGLLALAQYCYYLANHYSFPQIIVVCLPAPVFLFNEGKFMPLSQFQKEAQPLQLLYTNKKGKTKEIREVGICVTWMLSILVRRLLMAKQPLAQSIKLPSWAVRDLSPQFLRAPHLDIAQVGETYDLMQDDSYGQFIVEQQPLSAHFSNKENHTSFVYFLLQLVKQIQQFDDK